MCIRCIDFCLFLQILELFRQSGIFFFRFIAPDNAQTVCIFPNLWSIERQSMDFRIHSNILLTLTSTVLYKSICRRCYGQHSKSVRHDRISVFHSFLYLFPMFLTNFMYKHCYCGVHHDICS